MAFASINLIEAALASAGQILLHGAALQLPSSAAAMLIFAPSGRGKTTTSLALALGGFRLMTDDATVLLWGPERRATAWGLPRALKVHRNTARLLPELSPLLGGTYSSDDEQVLTTAALSTLAPVAPLQPLPVAAVVVLGDRRKGAHEFRPLTKSRALTFIAQDNVRRAPGGVAADQLARFRALSSLIAQTPSFELCVGDDLRSVVAAVSEVTGTS